jgi:hypothetical protein
MSTENPYQSPLTHAGDAKHEGRATAETSILLRPGRAVFWLGLFLLGALTTLFGAACLVAAVAGVLGVFKFGPDHWEDVMVSFGCGACMAAMGLFLARRAVKRLNAM